MADDGDRPKVSLSRDDIPAIPDRIYVVMHRKDGGQWSLSGYRDVVSFGEFAAYERQDVLAEKFPEEEFVVTVFDVRTSEERADVALVVGGDIIQAINEDARHRA